MHAEDVADTLDLAVAASSCDSATVLHKPRLLSGNGTSYIAGKQHPKPLAASAAS